MSGPAGPREDAHPQAEGAGAQGIDWDRFVESSSNPAYPQLSAWAEVKRPNGWRAARLRGSDADAPGVQVLLHDLGPTPWRVGYAPRGPVGRDFAAARVAELTEQVRRLASEERLSHVTIDPEIEKPHPLSDALRSTGWRPARPIQPDRSRIVDLTAPEESLWSDLRGKWRQYVQKARRAGVAIVDADASGLDDFFRIYVETARRAGFVHRAESAYRRTFECFSREGRARLLFATLDGERVATLMLLHCGPRVIEPYGGMTDRAAESRANYLLKWEAIRSSQERGFAVYDMWGLAHPGIEHFKAGFGGREVSYIGAWELVTVAPVRFAMGVAQRVRVGLARRLQGVGDAVSGDAG